MRPSNIRLTVAVGDTETRAVAHGKLPIWLLGTDDRSCWTADSQGNLCPSLTSIFKPTVDTVRNLNCRLGDQPPFLWFKFQDPRTNKGRLSPVFLKGWSFPYPCGGAWDALVRPNVPISTDQENYLVRVALMEIVVDETFNAMMSASRQAVMDSDWVDLTIDEDEIARQLSPEIMKTWINLPPPESKAIALTRPAPKGRHNRHFQPAAGKSEMGRKNFPSHGRNSRYGPRVCGGRQTWPPAYLAGWLAAAAWRATTATTSAGDATTSAGDAAVAVSPVGAAVGGRGCSLPGTAQEARRYDDRRRRHAQRARLVWLRL